jgi:DNA polymerase I-like protein with 3'-5' exonuclease and polymerase domains
MKKPPTTNTKLPPALPSIGLDIETINLKPDKGTIWSLTLTFSKNFPIKKFSGKSVIYSNPMGLTRKDIPAEVIALIESGLYLVIIHSSEFDGPYIGLNIGFRIPYLWDSQLCEVVIQGIRVSKEAPPNVHKAYSSKLLHVKPRYGFKAPNKDTRDNFIDRPLGMPFTRLEKEYMVEDTDALPAIQHAQEYLLTRDGDLNVALLENKLAVRVIDMRIKGVGFDQVFWRKNAEFNTNEYNKRISRLPAMVDNWNSPAQVKAFFKKIGINITSYKEIYKVYLRTRNRKLAEVIWAKELAKSVSTYGMNWFSDGYIDSDGRVRASIDQIVDTGRMSVSNPPLQQMPGVDIKNQQKQRAIKLIIEQLGLKGRLVPQHRRAFIPGKGKVFIAGDFGGQEMGIMAAASGEELWINAMLRGEDIHALTASLLYAREWPEATEKGCKFPFKCDCKGHKALREPTKILNFMLAYGGGPQKFAEDTGIDELTATMIVARYKRIIPKLTAWLEKNGRDGVNTGWSYSADPYRRKRRLHGEEEWMIRNQGKNTPVQAAGGNMIKLAMISIPMKWHIPLVVHDEIILEVDIKEAKIAAKALKKIMEDSANYITGIKGLVRVEPRIAKSWMKDDSDIILNRDGKFKLAKAA